MVPKVAEARPTVALTRALLSQGGVKPKPLPPPKPRQPLLDACSHQQVRAGGHEAHLCPQGSIAAASATSTGTHRARPWWQQQQLMRGWLCKGLGRGGIRVVGRGGVSIASWRHGGGGCIVACILLFDVNDVNPRWPHPLRRHARMEAHGKPCHVAPLRPSLLPPHINQQNDHRGGQCPLPHCNPRLHVPLPAN